MPASVIHENANQCHNLRNRPPLASWLSNSQTKSDQARLHAIGNMVIPKCATLAMHLLVNSHRCQHNRWSQEGEGLNNHAPTVLFSCLERYDSLKLGSRVFTLVDWGLDTYNLQGVWSLKPGAQQTPTTLSCAHASNVSFKTWLEVFHLR